VLVLECVINISEGHDGPALRAIVDAAGDALLDLHRDEHHNRSVLTVVGEDAPRAVAAVAVDRLDIRTHVGAHPRIGVVDVVPFVPLAGSTFADALRARNDFAAWAQAELGLPCLLYGPERPLPELRRMTFTPHPTAGGCAVGAREVLVAYNLWLADADLPLAKEIAEAIRSPAIRALGFHVGDAVQVSCNLVDPRRVGPADVYDLVAERAEVARAELVGLVPRDVLHAVPAGRWEALDLDEDRTIERRIENVRR
jgi:glutamate formiminotransferase